MGTNTLEGSNSLPLSTSTSHVPPTVSSQTVGRRRRTGSHGGDGGNDDHQPQGQVNLDQHSRREPIDPWCDDGSVSRAEPPWLRDKRIKHTKDRLEALKARRASTNPFEGDLAAVGAVSPASTNPFDSSSWSDSSSSQQQKHHSRHNSKDLAPPSLPNTRPPKSCLNPFDSSVSSDNPSKSPNRPTGNNPFDNSSTEESKKTVTTMEPPVYDSYRLPTRPKIVRPSQQYRPGATVASKDSGQDSLDQFLQDTTDETGASSDPEGPHISDHQPHNHRGGVITPTSDVPGTPTSAISRTPSEKALQAAKALKKSFHRPSPNSSKKDRSTSYSSGWSSQAGYSTQQSDDQLLLTPRTPHTPSVGEFKSKPVATPVTLSPGESARQPSSRSGFVHSPTIRMVPVPTTDDSHNVGTAANLAHDSAMSNFRTVTPTASVSPNSEETAKTEHDDEKQSTGSEPTSDSHLALHDLCDEGRTTDDIAWRNALYLLSIQPHLASQIEPEGQMSPLHVACLAQEPPPIWMTRGLLYTNPQQCQEPDLGGRLPLHLLAATSADPATMQLIVEEFPASVAHCDARGFTPLHLLLKNYQVDLTLEHLRILLGQTQSEGSKNDGKNQRKRPLFRKREHLQQSFQDLQSLQSEQEAKHESTFEEFPDDVRRALNKITQWKRRQRNRGLAQSNNANKLAMVYENPASIATSSGQFLPLHLLVRRPPNDPVVKEFGQPLLATQETLVHVLIAAYPEALITKDAQGRTPLLTSMLHSKSLPSSDVVHLLLGLQTPGFADDPTQSPAKLASSDTLQLPLHVAAEEIPHDFALLSCIAEAYPGAVQVQDIRGRTPLHCALQNYKGVPLNQNVFELLATDQVAKTADWDGKRPLDLIVEHPTCLEYIEDKDGLLLASFLDSSIIVPRNDRQNQDLLRKIKSVQPWLRRHACASRKVQHCLLEQMASPLNTFLILLKGTAIVALIVAVRIALDEEETVTSKPWVLVNCLAGYHLVTQVAHWGVAIYLGEFYRFVLTNVWCWIDLVGICCALKVAAEVRGDSGTFGEFFEVNSNGTIVPAYKDEFLQSLGAWTTGLLWASLVGYLTQVWCGMAVFVGSAVRLLETLFWPLGLGLMGIVAMSQILFTMENCLEGYTCGRADAFTTVYWLILGEPVLGNGEMSFFDTPMTSSMVATMLCFTLLWLWWILSVVVMTVSEASLLDRNLIAQRWFWEPKIALTVFAPSKPKLDEPLSIAQRYCGYMGRLWEIFTFPVENKHPKEQVHWYSCCNRPGIVILTRILALFVVPVWFMLGVATLGLLWPPQIRRWIFSTKIVNRNKRKAIDDELTVAKLSHLKGELQQLQTQSMEQNYAMQQDLAQIKEILFRAMMDE